MRSFWGRAPVGACAAPGGFLLRCCEGFGPEEGTGPFRAVFSCYRARPPMTEEEAGEELRGLCERRARHAGAAERLELCERLDCPPPRLAEALFEAALAGSGHDVLAACAEAIGALGFGEGDVVLEWAGAGDLDPLDGVTRLFVDPSAAGELRALKRELGYARVDEVPAGALPRVEAVVAALEAAPSPQEAAAAYLAENPGCFSGR